MKRKKEKLKISIKENLKLMNTPLMSILPGQVSFFIILSIIPLASIFVMVISKLSFNFDIIINFVSSYLPKGVATVILSIFEQQKVTSFDLFFIIMAFYLASKATHSIIVASTRIYNGEQKDFIRTRIKAIIMLVILVMLIAILIGLITVGGKLVSYLSNLNVNIHPIITLFYTILKWPFMVFVVFFTIKIIYTIAPNVTIPSSSVNKGAMFTTIVWVLSTGIFSFYATNIANYTKFYGNLSNLIVLMIWIYWLCYIFVFGMTINENAFVNNNAKNPL